jgi:HEAT repeat protein
MNLSTFWLTEDPQDPSSTPEIGTFSGRFTTKSATTGDSALSVNYPGRAMTDKQTLLQILRGIDSDDRWVRASAAEALCAVGDPDFILRGLARSSGDLYVRRRLLGALAPVRGWRATCFLVRGTFDRDAQIRQVVAESWRKRHGGMATLGLSLLARDGRLSVRDTALTGLAERGWRSAVERLCRR